MNFIKKKIDLLKAKSEETDTKEVLLNSFRSFKDKPIYLKLMPIFIGLMVSFLLSFILPNNVEQLDKAKQIAGIAKIANDLSNGDYSSIKALKDKAKERVKDSIENKRSEIEAKKAEKIGHIKSVKAEKITIKDSFMDPDNNDWLYVEVPGGSERDYIRTGSKDVILSTLNSYKETDDVRGATAKDLWPFIVDSSNPNSEYYEIARRVFGDHNIKEIYKSIGVKGEGEESEDYAKRQAIYFLNKNNIKTIDDFKYLAYNINYSFLIKNYYF